MKAGKLVPDEITIKMILERIAQADCKNGCVFDGFPRTLEQAKALDAALEKQGKSIEKAIYIEVPEESAAGQADRPLGLPHLPVPLPSEELSRPRRRAFAISAQVSFTRGPMIRKRPSRNA